MNANFSLLLLNVSFLFFWRSPGTPVVTPVVESVIEQKIVGHTVVGEGILAEKYQYHVQNELGEASYGHSEPTQTNNAIQDAAGNKAGSFSYVAPDGRVLTTNYVADSNGYRAASNALPIHEHSRRRRSVILTSSPLVNEATITHIPGHLSTFRLDTINRPIVSSNILSTVPHT